jgi:nucleoid-associated protein
MTISISNAVLHQIEKNELEELSLNFRSECLPVNLATESLVMELHKTYQAKSNKGFGSFLLDSEFKLLLSAYLDDELSFIDFSKKAAERLLDELTKYPFADSGSLIIACYTSLATDQMIVALIPSSPGMQVKPTLDIGSTDHMDIESMTIAARIDLTIMVTEPESNRYITFLKGRAGRRVADFFLDSLGVESGLDIKTQNCVLLQAVEDWLSDTELERDEKLNIRKQIKTYGKDVNSAGEEIQIKELSTELPIPDGQTFESYVEDNGYELEPTFPAHKATLDGLDKFKGAGGGLNISFDAQLLSERIFYDPETDTLTIKGTPPNLRDQLLRRA